MTTHNRDCRELAALRTVLLNRLLDAYPKDTFTILDPETIQAPNFGGHGPLTLSLYNAHKLLHAGTATIATLVEDQLASFKEIAASPDLFQQSYGAIKPQLRLQMVSPGRIANTLKQLSDPQPRNKVLMRPTGIEAVAVAVAIDMPTTVQLVNGDLTEAWAGYPGEDAMFLHAAANHQAMLAAEVEPVRPMPVPFATGAGVHIFHAPSAYAATLFLFPAMLRSLVGYGNRPEPILVTVPGRDTCIVITGRITPMLVDLAVMLAQVHYQQEANHLSPRLMVVDRELRATPWTTPASS